ncbi:MAG TPA: MarR family transcriptional regulator [Acidimicrobiales bacterium]
MVRKPLPVDPVQESRRVWEKRWGTEAGVAMAAAASILRAENWLLGELNTVLSPLGLTFPRYEALNVLMSADPDGLALARFVSRLQVHPTSITNIIDRLERDGLVRRVPHATDRRSLLAQLTDKGRETAEEAARLLNDCRFCLPDVPDDDLESLVEVIREIRRRAGDFTDDPVAEI